MSLCVCVCERECECECVSVSVSVCVQKVRGVRYNGTVMINSTQCSLHRPSLSLAVGV